MGYKCSYSKLFLAGDSKKPDRQKDRKRKGIEMERNRADTQTSRKAGKQRVKENGKKVQ